MLLQAQESPERKFFEESKVTGSGAGRPDSPGGQAGRPRRSLDRSGLTPEVTDWAEHLRELVDGAFHKDREAAVALKIDAPDLSKFLSGRKAPERSFVRHVHAVCAEKRGTAVDSQAQQRTDMLYMRALQQLNPQVWELLTVLDERDAATARERAAQRDLNQLRGRVSQSDNEAERLRRELRTVREERAQLAAKVERLLRQVRGLREEAVVAEAIRIAERAASEPEPLLGFNSLVVRWSGTVIAGSGLACVAGVALALIGTPLAENGSPWLTGGSVVAGGAALVGAGAGRWRHEALRRLGAVWKDINAEPLTALLFVLACAAPLLLLNTGIRSQQDYTEHRVKVPAAVSKCKEYRRYNKDNVHTGSSYKCTYTWKVEGHTYEHRDWAMKSEEGVGTTVLIDPADPSAMLPDRFILRSYIHMYVLALLALALPAGALYLYRRERHATGVEVRRARLRADNAAPTFPKPRMMI